MRERGEDDIHTCTYKLTYIHTYTHLYIYIYILLRHLRAASRLHTAVGEAGLLINSGLDRKDYEGGMNNRNGKCLRRKYIK